MRLSAESQERLNQLNAQRDYYQYGDDAMRAKTLTVLIGPTSVGKSTIISTLLELGAQQSLDTGEVGSLMTRHRRVGSDPDNYRTANEGITHAVMLEMIERRKLVNWSLSPTGDIYGTAPDSYPATHNFLPLLPDSIPMLKRAGFQALYAIYITAPLNDWSPHLNERRGDASYAGRIDEGINSLKFAKANLTQLYIIDNPADEPGSTIQIAKTAQKVLDIALGRTDGPYQESEAVKHLGDMLHYAQQERDALEERLHGNA